MSNLQKLWISKTKRLFDEAEKSDVWFEDAEKLYRELGHRVDTRPHAVSHDAASACYDRVDALAQRVSLLALPPWKRKGVPNVHEKISKDIARFHQDVELTKLQLRDIKQSFANDPTSIKLAENSSFSSIEDAIESLEAHVREGEERLRMLLPPPRGLADLGLS